LRPCLMLSPSRVQAACPETTTAASAA
jgi:hypothetical protein